MRELIRPFEQAWLRESEMGCVAVMVASDGIEPPMAAFKTERCGGGGPECNFGTWAENAGQGRGFSAAEQSAIELRAMELVRQALEIDGFAPRRLCAPRGRNRFRLSLDRG